MMKPIRFDVGHGLGPVFALVRGTEQLEGQLTELADRTASARRYLDQPGCNRTLGEGRLDQLRTKRSGLLALLRANRRQLRKLGLGEC